MKIWRSASQEMVSRLREFCFQLSWYQKQRKRNRERAKKKIQLFCCLHKLLYAAVISHVTNKFVFHKKKKNSCAASAEGGTLLVCKNSCVLRRCSPPAIANSGSSHVLTPCLYVRVKGQGFLSRWKLPKTIWLERKWPQYKAHNILAFWPTHCPLLVCGCAVVMRESCGWVTSYQGQE